MLEIDATEVPPPPVARPDFISKPAPMTRLSEPRFEEEAARVYERAVQALADANVPFLVAGAVAFNHYTGIWRDTKDLDVFLERDALPRALAVLADADFEVEEIYRSWLAKAWDGDVFVDLIHRGANLENPVDASWFERAETIRLFDRDVPVMSAEDLLVSKMFVGCRVRFDGADILHLLHVRAPEMDWDAIVRLAGEHAGLLVAYAHMYRWAYPAFANRLPERAMRALEARARDDTAAPPVPFRGTLLDLVSFTVDVKGWGLPDPHGMKLAELRERWGVPQGERFE